MKRLFDYPRGIDLINLAFAVCRSSLDGLLTSQINASPLALTPVVITFNHKPTNSDFLHAQIARYHRRPLPEPAADRAHEG